jgi:hypothetical protein
VEVFILKANESNKHYASKVRECSNFAVREIKKVCEQVGPRPAGFEGEQKAQDYVEKVMTPIADEVVREKFTLSPKAFMSWVTIDGVLALISAVLGIIAFTGIVPQFADAFHIASVVLCAVAVFFIIGEFLLYKQVLDPFFKKAESSNVICKYNATGEVKRRIIISGHIDSAYEWRYTYVGGAKMVTAVVVGAILGLLVTLGLGVAGIFLDDSSLNIGLIIAQAVVVPFLISVLFFVNWKLVVDGANDDLTGVFTSMAVILYLKHNDIRFENTEVIAMSAGAEEEGLRGSKAFAKAHDEFKNDSVETVFVALDTLRDYEFMGVVTKDMTGTVKLSKKACALMKKASENAGIDVNFTTIPLGATDAAAMQQAGVESVAFTSMDPAPARYYHTRLDTVKMLEMKTIEDSLKIALETVFLFDEQGLRETY